MLTIICVILFTISYDFAPNFMHYSQVILKIIIKTI